MQSNHTLRAVTFSAFPKTAWVAMGLAALFASAAIKFAFVDQAMDVAPYPLLGALGFLVWPAISFAMIGTLDAGDDGLKWRRNIGLAGSLARREIARIETYGSRSNDTLGIRVVPVAGSPIAFPRIKPESMIPILEDYGRGPQEPSKPLPDRDAFDAYAKGHVPNPMR